MKSLANDLPPDIASQIHPDWRRNEADYWAIRDSLLPQYRDHWVAFANGVVLAAGRKPADVLFSAHQSGRHPYVTCVGRENEPFRMRRSSFAYDQTYAGEALPRLSVEFRTSKASPGLQLDRVIPDTGADASALPWSDCQALQLDIGQGFPSRMGGMAGGPVSSVLFYVWAWLDGQAYSCHLFADFTGQERFLGRDVLNQLEMLFRGPASEIVVNP